MRVDGGAARLEIPDMILFDYKIFPGNRGLFAELLKQGEYLAAGVP